ncbi:hypothetical protein GGD88_003696 [Roseospira goensis]|uniref:Uncharacterized protein n=1 Tax=Roseospira goensis TaxID=391922 RepID=A0A7W6S316_9PROT|nr:hypothetical protein [Roseospira goensis]
MKTGDPTLLLLREQGQGLDALGHGMHGRA